MIPDSIKMLIDKGFKAGGSLYKEAADFIESNSLSSDEKAMLQFLYITMPFSDVGGYPPEFFYSFVSHQTMLEKKYSYLRDVPWDIRLWYVLFPRVNNEELSDCRGLFYKEIAPRTVDMDMQDTAIETNYWCAEQATYRTTDDRTASAIAVYNQGYGRCGEESVFGVSALRSIGIPARQVYVPWWSHCDDNHAWVEIYTGSGWKFLGACEPEPVLNRGWFTAAASRAMIVHSKLFCRATAEYAEKLLPSSDFKDVIVNDSVIYENQISRYAETKRFSILVKNGIEPLANVSIRLEVVNMAAFGAIATLNADSEGKASVTLGLGSVMIRVSFNGKNILKIVDTRETDCIALDVSEEHPEPKDFTFYAPAESEKNKTAITESQKLEKEERLEKARLLRENKKLPELREPWLKRIAKNLTEKDKSYFDKDVLKKYSGYMMRYEGEQPKDIFESYLLCPRVALEPLSYYPEFISAYFTEKEKSAFRKDPALIMVWVNENIADAGAGLLFVPATPEAVLKTRRGTVNDRLVLTVAIARSLGVPAYVKERQGLFIKDGRHIFFEPGNGERQGRIYCSAGENTSYLTDWAISKIDFGEVHVEESTDNIFELPYGNYRIMGAARKPNGDVIVSTSTFELCGDRLDTAPVIPVPKITDMLQQIPISPFEINGTSTKKLLEGGKRIFIWLEPSKEPTEHILNELIGLAGKYKSLAYAIALILPDEKRIEDALLQKAMSVLGIKDIYIDGRAENIVTVARRMYLDPEKLPLIMLMNKNHEILYAKNGYNVGTGDLLLRLIDISGGAHA